MTNFTETILRRDIYPGSNYCYIFVWKLRLYLHLYRPPTNEIISLFPFVVFISTLYTFEIYYPRTVR